MVTLKKSDLLANAVFSVKLMDGTVLQPGDFCWHGETAECCAGRFDFKFGEDSILSLRYENNTGDTVFLRDVFLDIPPVFNVADYLEYTRSLLFPEQQVGVKRVGLSTPYLEHNPESHMLYMLKKINSEESLFFGALPPCRGEFLRFQAVHESADMSGNFGVRIRYEEKRGVYWKQTDSCPYDDAVARTEKALQYGTLKAILWHQGESDCKAELAENHENSLRILLNDFRLRFNAKNVPLIIGQMPLFYHAPWKEAEKKLMPLTGKSSWKVPWRYMSPAKV